MAQEAEKETRKKCIDKRLRDQGWNIVLYHLVYNTPLFTKHAIEDYSTENGPNDFVLLEDGYLVGIIEAQKASVGTLNSLEQAKRYAKGVLHSIGIWNRYMVLFLYSSNGELISFLDARNDKNLPRQIADFHPSYTLKELFNRNYEECSKRPQEAPNDNAFMRPYWLNAVAQVEKEISEAKRRMLVVMATGTGKTFTAVNLIYWHLKSRADKSRHNSRNHARELLANWNLNHYLQRL